MIFGTALISGSLLAGYFLGECLGRICGIGNDVGGVGFAMLLLLLTTSYLKKRRLWRPEMDTGIRYWSGMYIPVVVAMSASQNVFSALGRGFLAILAGAGAVFAVFLILFLLSKADILGSEEG